MQTGLAHRLQNAFTTDQHFAALLFTITWGMQLFNSNISNTPLSCFAGMQSQMAEGM
jgi:hypothetical protein